MIQELLIAWAVICPSYGCQLQVEFSNQVLVYKVPAPDLFYVEYENSVHFHDKGHSLSLWLEYKADTIISTGYSIVGRDTINYNFKTCYK